MDSTSYYIYSDYLNNIRNYIIMEKNKLELRMFGFVPYQLKGIQGGIQYGHAVVDYGRMVRDIPELEEQYNDWADNWKTFIVYNGGNTNDREDYYGTMQIYRDQLRDNGVTYCEFREPDLGDVLTGVCFIADERVFDIKKYPDYKFNDFVNLDEYDYRGIDIMMYDETIDRLVSDGETALVNEYKKWVESIGGKKNLFLRNFRKQFSLAT